MDFSLSPELRALRDKTRRFIAEQVIPLEGDPRQSHHGPDEALRRELVARARAAGLLTPHASREMGGLGLSHVEKAVVFEDAGYSRLGPTALNIHAPDEGNIHLMEEVATPAQKERWLRPQVAGELRSCFAMTEPSPGAGADPSMLQATAVRDGGDYVINGRKWFITGADGADYAIVMAPMEDGSATMFLTDMDRPGIVLERNMDAMDACFTGGHGVLRLDNLRVPASDVLGEIGKGFRYAQVRLAPARLTHCMRWLGLARRAMAVAVDDVGARSSFGQKLADREGVQWLLGDAAMQIEIGRLLTMRAAARLDQGDFARKEISMAKIVVSETLHKVVDTALQLNGARGYSKDTPLEWIYRYARQARLVDGASEVHKMVLARYLMDQGDAFWHWDDADAPRKALV